ncbi:gamma-glutamylputrescine oxidase [Cohaesibacter sp. ES.047]|uniref:NAD(P)/FAD-dependent oxidoreductase n=1 Tax=Cohaesibacter sp. ES.047 TaxID=1798205 RepID=UPI000BB688E3|nr:FAD-binding oxidoreductase [Cohaesibacter sp. ES.047]SNY94292.1 gamma-glutamylputrescine oxidase [Cohaesibacter sp. ES.047]
MTVRDYIDSYYKDSKVESDSFPPVADHVECEVAIIGGGLAGLTAARELLKLGKHVVLIEENRVGWGASGRNGGFVSDGYAEGLGKLEDWLGLEQAKALFSLSRQGTDYVRHTIDELKAPGVSVEDGWLRVLRHDDAAGLEARVTETNERFGTSYSYWPTERVREVLSSGRYFQGMDDPRAFHIQPLNYALALARDIKRLGGAICEHSKARCLIKEAGSWRIETDDGGSVRAGAVLLCGSAYMKDLYPRLERAVLPVATYVITSEPMGERLSDAIRYRGCIGDTRRAGDYYRLVDGGERLLWGGRMTTRRSEPAKLAQMLKRDIVSIYPQLGDFEVTHAWAGLMGYCLHKMPILKELEPGIWAATATGGHGLNATASIGMAAAQGIAGVSDHYKLFAPFKARWGGGPVGRVGTQMVYWGLQAMDWWEERRSHHP